MSGTTPNELAQQLLLAVKMQQDSKPLQTQLAALSFTDLRHALQDAKQQKAFWINCYNAYFLILKREKKIDKPAIYTQALLTIAQQKFSLDDIEHGILRRFRYKYSLGYFPNFFTPAPIRTLAVPKIDYRLHFALNCGAKSCPPIAFYTPEKIDQQLDFATQAFLESESDFDEQHQVVYTTRLFLWFLGDFGGIKGIKSIFQQQLGKDLTGYRIRYKAYSWEEDLGNFVE
ncbi:MAG: DUF547 domain-containing protein [Aureispira sp.]